MVSNFGTMLAILRVRGNYLDWSPCTTEIYFFYQPQKVERQSRLWWHMSSECKEQEEILSNNLFGIVTILQAHCLKHV